VAWRRRRVARGMEVRVMGVGLTLCGDICGMFKVLIACNEVVEKLCVWDERTGRGARRLYKNTVRGYLTSSTSIYLNIDI